jgi:hypothetical protein
MVGRPGRLQTVFHSLEIDPLLHERSELKAYGSGLAHAENVQAFPQGGFRHRNGLRDIGGVPSDAARVFSFDASEGSAYDVILRSGAADIWGATALLQSVSITGLTIAMLPEVTTAQQLDTMLVFHEDLQTKRLKHAGPTSWSVDNVPWEGIFNYDFGADINGDPYTNGVAAVWTLEFVGLADSDGAGTDDRLGVFAITVSGQDTVSISYDANMTTLAALIQAAILDLPNIATGLTVAAGTGDKVVITFGGSDNSGDGWAVSGRVINKTDAAILASKTTPGVAPGEPLFSADRGWPQCGCFSGAQRLLIGGFRSLNSAWAFSRQADYYNFDERFDEATGPALVLMAGAGGERIERIVESLNPLIFTSKAEYWLAERAISKTTAPQHVKASTFGSRRGVPIAENEGAAIFAHSGGGVLSEMRYTDVEGNFASLNISLFGSHLVKGVVDLAVRRAAQSSDGNQLHIVNADGGARLSTMLREQEVMGFSRMSSGQGVFKAVAVNGRNEASWLVQRPSGRRLERSEEGLLLDEAVSTINVSPAASVPCGSRFNGREVWCLADGNVFGPFTVSGGAFTLPIAVSEWTVGCWYPPRVDTLPMPRAIGPNMVLKRKARIHSVKISVIDTTSIAISTNGKPLVDIDLLRWGMVADVPELHQGVTGEITVRGLTGFADEPYVTISQTRPGRLEVRSITLEAQI